MEKKFNTSVNIPRIISGLLLYDISKVLRCFKDTGHWNASLALTNCSHVNVSNTVSKIKYRLQLNLLVAFYQLKWLSKIISDSAVSATRGSLASSHHTTSKTKLYWYTVCPFAYLLAMAAYSPELWTRKASTDPECLESRSYSLYGLLQKILAKSRAKDKWHGLTGQIQALINQGIYSNYFHL